MSCSSLWLSVFIASSLYTSTNKEFRSSKIAQSKKIDELIFHLGISRSRKPTSSYAMRMSAGHVQEVYVQFE